MKKEKMMKSFQNDGYSLAIWDFDDSYMQMSFLVIISSNIIMSLIIVC